MLTLATPTMGPLAMGWPFPPEKPLAWPVVEVCEPGGEELCPEVGVLPGWPGVCEPLLEAWSDDPGWEKAPLGFTPALLPKAEFELLPKAELELPKLELELPKLELLPKPEP